MRFFRLPVDHMAAGSEREAVDQMGLGETIQGSSDLVLRAAKPLCYVARLLHCARPGVEIEQYIEFY